MKSTNTHNNNMIETMIQTNIHSMFHHANHHPVPYLKEEDPCLRTPPGSKRSLAFREDVPLKKAQAEPPQSSARKRSLVFQEITPLKKARTEISEADAPEAGTEIPVTEEDVFIVQSENQVTIYSNLMHQHPLTVAAKFVAQVEANRGQFILLQPNGTTQMLRKETEKIQYVIEARKQRGLYPVKSRMGADILVVKSGSKVTLYSDWMRQRPDVVGAAQLVAQVRSEAGKFVLLQEDGIHEFVQDEKEMINLVIAARKEDNLSPIISSPYREVRNLVLNEEEPDILALDMRNDVLKRSAPFQVKNMYHLGGSKFQPVLRVEDVRTFIQRANKLNHRSDDALYKLIYELDDEEDAVHLYRNFHDEPNYYSDDISRPADPEIPFSRREIDILAASILYGIDREYTWNFMPYRNRKSIYKLYVDRNFNKKIKIMLKDHIYVQHLNRCVCPFFEEEIHV